MLTLPLNEKPSFENHKVLANSIISFVCGCGKCLEEEITTQNSTLCIDNTLWNYQIVNLFFQL